MKDFEAIIAEIKLYLAINSNKKVLDKDVAEALSMSQANFATIKRRNRIPYRNVLEFCNQEDICCRKIFFN